MGRITETRNNRWRHLEMFQTTNIFPFLYNVLRDVETIVSLYSPIHHNEHHMDCFVMRDIENCVINGHGVRVCRGHGLQFSSTDIFIYFP
ncbi:hypothetical protein XELAEV_18021772mg [Xenopus laevis]|uniref:Uncharacterized protein n=1 Tax=Xenopus laevis TaxID=8355 RepID=A0A974HMT2_XENLA|nr:hypothetical protein XELAEV_18021772mg [Xenopus laevis]